MADGIKVDTRELDAALAKVDKAARDLTAANQLAAEALLPGVRQRTPVLTGDLAGSYRVEADARGGRIVSDLDYALVVEYGSSKRGIEGAGMGQETVDASERELVDAYELALAKAFRDAGFDVK